GVAEFRPGQVGNLPYEEEETREGHAAMSILTHRQMLFVGQVSNLPWSEFRYAPDCGQVGNLPHVSPNTLRKTAFAGERLKAACPKLLLCVGTGLARWRHHAFRPEIDGHRPVHFVIV